MRERARACMPNRRKKGEVDSGRSNEKGGLRRERVQAKGRCERRVRAKRMMDEDDALYA